MPSAFERATVFIADAGPFITYYVIGSSITRSIGCFAAAGVGVIGSCMDFINYNYLNPNGRPWPRLLNTAEMCVYLAMAILFVIDTNCKMWSNSLQMVGITIALVGGMFTSKQCLADDIARSEDEDGKILSSKGIREAAREIAWIVVIAFVVMTISCFAVPIYRVINNGPADDRYRVLFNWIFPMVALGGMILAISFYWGPKLGKAKEEALNTGNNVEGSGLLTNQNQQDGQDNQQKEDDHVAIFPIILILSLVPVILIASLTALGGDQCY